MRNSFHILGLYFAVLLTAMACVLPNYIKPAGSHFIRTVPKPSPSPKVLFQDDFSARASWTTFNDNEVVNEYTDGGYRIYINKANWIFWGTPGVNFSDVMITVEATSVAGPEQNEFGIICRYEDERNFYKFVLGSDGYFGISKVINGEEHLVGMETLQSNAQVIKMGTGMKNLIRAECVGDRLALYANDQPLVVVQDADLVSGNIGLIAGTYDIPGVDILFDNLTVTMP